MEAGTRGTEAGGERDVYSCCSLRHKKQCTLYLLLLTVVSSPHSSLSLPTGYVLFFALLSSTPVIHDADGDITGSRIDPKGVRREGK